MYENYQHLITENIDQYRKADLLHRVDAYIRDEESIRLQLEVMQMQ